MGTISLRSFTAGELTPELYSRVDTQKYQTGLKTCRNNIVGKTGGVFNRSGTEFLGITQATNDGPMRLFPFIFSDDQTYILEFNYVRMRVIKDGAYVTDTAQNITAITNANPCVITYSGADNYASQDRVYISGIVGPIGTYLNGRWVRVGTVDTGANTFIIKDVASGTDINSTSYGAYTSGGTVEEVYSLSCPYSSTDFADVKFSQSGDIITLVHPSYAPRELSRTADNAWAFTTILFEPDIARPASGAATGSAGASTRRYKVTAIDNITGEESLSCTSGTAKTITAITNANPGVFTATAHGFSLDEIFITGLTDMPTLNNKRYVAESIAADTFKIIDFDTDTYVDTTSGVGLYITGASAIQSEIDATAYLVSAVANPVTLTWTKNSSASKYKIYRFDTYAYGYIGVTYEPTFVDTGSTVDYDISCPEKYNPFQSANNYPSVVCHAQQRIFYASTNNNPESFWASKIGLYHNFISPNTIVDDSPITATLANRKVQAIKSIIDSDKLICMTSGSEIAFIGKDLGLVTPTAVNPKAQSYNGVNDLRPILIDSNIIYCQNRSSIIRDFLFDFSSDVYKGNDLTIFSKHLFDGFTIVDWDYQQNSDSILWCVRSDGVLLGLTYIRDQQILAWHRHDIGGGTVENVCVVPEGNEDAVYIVVQRTINGTAVKYTERLSNRFIDDVIDNKFMDCAATYDGRHTGATTMTISGSGWTYQDTLTLTASAASFLSTDVGNQIHLTGSDGTLIRFTIDAYTSTTVVTGRPNKTVPAAMRAIAISYSATLGTGWSKAVDVITGLWHLEGENVSVFADRFVVGSPNNPDYPTYTVSSGLITLDKPYAVVHVGLPYISDLETLDIDYDQSDTIANKKILITEVSARVHKSRSMWVGSEAPSDDDTDALEGLTELKIRNNEAYDDPVALKSDVVQIQIQSHWNSNGRVFIRNTEPLPLAISSIFPSGKIPGGR